jgi:hypothetical protein
MADYLPYFQCVPPYSGPTASAAITGGQILESTGVNTVGPTAGSSAKVVGIAAFDCAIGAQPTIHPIHGNVHETVSAAGSAAGDRLTSGAAGGVVTGAAATLAAAGTDLGVCINTATAGNKVRWVAR